MGFPENIRSITTDELVEVFVWHGLCERRVLGNDDEKNNTTGEDVNCSSIIWFLEVDFWSHVALCS